MRFPNSAAGLGGMSFPARATVGGGGPVQLTRIAATRGQVMNNASLVGGPGQSNYNRLESRILHKTGPDGMVNPTGWFNGIYYNVPETPQPSNAQVEMGIEYLGSTVMATFAGGSPTGTIIAGTPLYGSDPMVGVSIPPNTEYYERTGLIIPSGSQYMLGGMAFTTLGESCYLSTSATSQVSGTGVMALPSGGALSGSHGGTIFMTSTGVKTRPQVEVLGNSLFSAKSFDGVGDGHGNIGFIKPALWAAPGGVVPFTDFARSSADEHGYATSSAWQPALDYVSHLFVDLGTNGLNLPATGNYTLPNIKIDLQAVWAAAKAKGVKVYQMIIWPRTTSTNNWTDAAGQTPRSRFEVGGDRDLLNAWIHAQVGTLIDGVIDLLPQVEDQAVPGVWQTTGVANATTVDGTHPSQTKWRSLQTVATAMMPSLLV